MDCRPGFILTTVHEDVGEKIPLGIKQTTLIDGSERMQRTWMELNEMKGCKGANQWLGSRPTLCARWMQCPPCEQKRANRRCYALCKRLQNEIDLAEDEEADLKVGVLTTTLPGRSSWIRHQDLYTQYEFMTKRTNFIGETGEHSMRGLNTLLAKEGIMGGCHNIEMTWAKEPHKQWWNVHNHSIIVGDSDIIGDFFLEETKLETEVEDELLLDKFVYGKNSSKLSNLGLGPRYSLDWADSSEFEATIRYASKLAYMTKPVKATHDRSLELMSFWKGSNGGKEPRMSRPFGSWMKSYVPCNPI